MQPAIPVPLIIAFITVVTALLLLVLGGLNSALKKSGAAAAYRRKKVFLTAFVITGWILFVCFLSTQNFLNDFYVMPPRMTLVLLPPLIAAIVLANSRSVSKLLEHVPQHWLVFLESYRLITAVVFYFLFIYHVIPVQMTFAGRNFDIVIGITAPVIGWLIYRKKLPPGILIAWNILGLVLISIVVVMAVLSAPFPFRLFHEAEASTMIAYFPFALMPGFVIPVAYTMHIFSLKKSLHGLIMHAKQLKDTRLRIAGIPLITILLTVILHRQANLLSFDFIFSFIISLSFTALLWHGDRLIITRLRIKFPDYNQTIERNAFEFLFIALFTFLTVTIIDTILVMYVFHHPPSFGGTVKDLGIGMFVSCVMLIVYESIYFFEKWKLNIVEAENLKRIRLQNRLDSLKSQVNPHFLFNSLNSLSLLIREDKKKAASFVQEMAQVYRYILQSNENDLSTLEKEIQFIRSYMFLQRIRFDGHITGQINVPASYLNHRIPSLTLQSLVDKAIRHNIISARQPLCISIFISPAHSLIVSNNLQKKSALVKMQSFSLYNIKNRYEMHGQYDIKIEELREEFKVTLPLINTPASE